jgi:hypothetical protein
MQLATGKWATRFAICATVACTQSASAQISLDTIGGGMSWQLYPAPDAPTIFTGVIFETSGATLKGALVSLKGTEIGTVTDDRGRFRLRLPGPGMFAVEIRSLGYRSVVDSILLPPDFAIFATAVLRHGVPGLCGLVGNSPYFRADDLNIEVVDSLTGDPPPTTVTIRVIQGDSVWERSRKLRSEPGGRVIGLGRPITTFGKHDLEIRAAGYEVWRQEDVELWLIEGCYPRLRNNSHVAKLAPLW